jgi:hypothetical protein
VTRREVMSAPEIAEMDFWMAVILCPTFCGGLLYWDPGIAAAILSSIPVLEEYFLEFLLYLTI